MLSDERIREIEERGNQATPGPWAWDSRGDKNTDVQIGIACGKDSMPVGGFVAEDDDVIYVESVAQLTGSNPHSDADFIAHAREDIDDLLEEVRRLREQREALLLAYAELDEAVLAKGLQNMKAIELESPLHALWGVMHWLKTGERKFAAARFTVPAGDANPPYTLVESSLDLYCSAAQIRALCKAAGSTTAPADDAKEND